MKAMIRIDQIVVDSEAKIDERVVEVYAEWLRSGRTLEGRDFLDFVHEHPAEVFADYTFISSATAKAIKRASPFGHIPLIDYDEKLGFVYHTLLTNDGLCSKKPIASQFSDKKESSGEEAAIEKALCTRLAKSNPKRQVRCYCGIADIVTDDSIIEVKVFLDRGPVLSAIGQVLAYRQCIDPSLKPFIAGRKCASFDAESICNPLGINVLYVEDGKS